MTGAGLAPVIPLPGIHANRLATVSGPASPEPVALYGLTMLAMLLHKPTGQPQMCLRCKEKWPCEHLRLAYRLREGF